MHILLYDWNSVQVRQSRALNIFNIYVCTDVSSLAIVSLLVWRLVSVFTIHRALKSFKVRYMLQKRQHYAWATFGYKYVSLCSKTYSKPISALYKAFIISYDHQICSHGSIVSVCTHTYFRPITSSDHLCIYCCMIEILYKCVSLVP